MDVAILGKDNLSFVVMVVIICCMTKFSFSKIVAGSYSGSK